MGNSNEVEKFVAHVLRLREDPAARADLRRGWDERSEHYAFPHLTHTWVGRNYLKDVHLTFAALAAATPRVASSDVRLGQIAQTLVQWGALSENNMRRKLLAIQNLPLRHARTVFRQILVLANRLGLGVDWVDVYWLVRRWDHRAADVRRRTRQSLLEAYFVAQSDPVSHQSGSDRNNASPSTSGDLK